MPPANQQSFTREQLLRFTDKFLVSGGDIRTSFLIDDKGDRIGDEQDILHDVAEQISRKARKNMGYLEQEDNTW